MKERPHEYLETSRALRSMLDDRLYSPEQSRRNILDSVVLLDSVIENDAYLSSGLMLTHNGIVLTAYHSIQRYIGMWEQSNDKRSRETENVCRNHIIDKKGRSYQVDTSFFVYDSDADVAVIKAMKKGKAASIGFNIRPLKPAEPVRLEAFVKEKPYTKYGLASISVNPFADELLIDIESTNGTSGGVIITLDGRLGGIVVGDVMQHGINITYTRAASISAVSSLIKEAADMLAKEHALLESLTRNMFSSSSLFL